MGDETDNLSGFLLEMSICVSFLGRKRLKSFKSRIFLLILQIVFENNI